MGPGSMYLMDFRLPLPPCCRGVWEAERGTALTLDRQLDLDGETVAVGSAFDAAGGGHGGQALVQRCVSDAA